MNHEDLSHELLLRHLEGRVNAAERAQVSDWLRTDPEPRAFLREVAEQAVVVADIARTEQGRQEALRLRAALASPPPPANVASVGFRSWRASLAAAAAIVVLLFALARTIAPASHPALRVTRVVGSGHFLGASGRLDGELKPGDRVSAGDTVETQTMDSWIELEADDGSTLTVAGRAALRVLGTEKRIQRYQLQEGNLWVKPPAGRGNRRTQVETPTVSLELQDAQLDVHSSSSETSLRVNEGTVRVRQLLDGSAVQVPQGFQLFASLRQDAPPRVTPQPVPVDYWACNLGRVPRVPVGQWLPPTAEEPARLGAAPLLWPVKGGKPVLLYASALSVLSTSDHPVLLLPGAKLKFRGRTEIPQTVRFGFKTQRMRGIFAGKFEVDVPAEKLGPAGVPWVVELPLDGFRALQPQLSDTPEGLEVTDVYALTIKVNAGLEINHVELIPAK